MNMNMATFKTLKHITSIDDDEDEVEIVYVRGFFRWLFDMNELTETFVGGGDVWYDKKTQMKVSDTKVLEINYILAWMNCHKK